MKHWEIAFTGTWPVLPVLLAGAAAGALAYAFYRRKRAELNPAVFGILAGLRMLGIAVVALFLLQPVVRITRTQLTASTVAVLLDASESMGIRDAAGDRSRFDAALGLLSDRPHVLMKRLEESHDVRTFAFGAITAESAALRDVQPDQKATAMAEALRETVKRTEADNLAGIVLLSDGVSNHGADPEAVARTLGVPVFAVALGGRAAEAGRFYDVGITRAPAHPQFIVNNRAAVAVELAHRGLTRFVEGERTMQLRLTDDEGQELAARAVRFPAADGTLAVELGFVPTRVGAHRLHLELDAVPDETVAENNRRTFTALVTDPRIRVLIVEGVVRSEYRFLRRVLESDPNLEVTAVVKLSGSRFLVQGVQAGVDLSRGLPARREDYDEFDVVVLGDVGREEFTGVQFEYLKDWVDGGGALLALGGYSAFGAGGYRDSALADLLPVRMGGETDGHVDASFVPVITGEGSSHPVLAGCADFFSDASAPGKLDGANRVTGAKPGALVLAVHPLERVSGGPMPVVAVQTYGSGRTMAMTADTTWKWKFQVEARGEDSPYYRFWRQSMRWLAGRKEDEARPDQLVTAWTARLEYEPDESVLLKARVLDRQKEPESRAEVQAAVSYPIPVRIEGPDGADATENGTTVTLAPMPLSPGEYQALWRPPASGLYEARATASDDQGELGSDEFEFVVGQAASEFDRVDADEAALRAVASQTGGAYYTLATAGQIPDELEQRRSMVVFRDELNLWNAPGFFAAFLLAVTAEWILRKRNGLN